MRELAPNLPFDNGGLEAADSAVRDVRRDGNKTQSPSMGVFQTLEALAPLEGLVLDSSFVLAQTLDGKDFLFGCEPAAHGVVWQEEHDEDADSNRDEPED